VISYVLDTPADVDISKVQKVWTELDGDAGTVFFEKIEV